LRDNKQHIFDVKKTWPAASWMQRHP